MKSLLSVTAVAVVLFIAGVRTGCPQAAGDVDSHQFEQLEQVWNEAHLRGDAQALEKLWSDDLEVDVPHMAAMTKDEVLAFVRSGRMKFSRYDTSDIHVRVYGDTAVVTGRMQRMRTISGKEVSDNWRFTKVYARQDRQWRVVTFHASEVTN